MEEDEDEEREKKKKEKVEGMQWVSVVMVSNQNLLIRSSMCAHDVENEQIVNSAHGFLTTPVCVHIHMSIMLLLLLQ